GNQVSCLVVTLDDFLAHRAADADLDGTRRRLTRGPTPQGHLELALARGGIKDLEEGVQGSHRPNIGANACKDRFDVRVAKRNGSGPRIAAGRSDHDQRVPDEDSVSLLRIERTQGSPLHR